MTATITADDALLAAATAARESAYAPYSGFRVGAAVRSREGEVFTGCNVENAAYPAGTCAEAGAIAAMAVTGARRIEAIAVVGTGSLPCLPCGGCRQRIREFADAATVVVVVDGQGRSRTYRLDDLLPHAFGPDNLDGAGRTDS